MKSIYKYELRGDDDNYLQSYVYLPEGARVLSAGAQGEHIFVWAEVSKEDAVIMIPRRFSVIGTGWELPEDFFEDKKFINTVFMGSFVFHVFEVL